MKVLYFDPILGVSGDMILAALIDLGVDPHLLKKDLRFIGKFDLVIRNITRGGVAAKNIQFKTRSKVKESDFIPMIKRSKLAPMVKGTAIRIIQRIFDVEKKVHQADHLHLHELADIDTMYDIVGSVVALDSLKVDRIFTRAVKAGKGFVKTREGKMPSHNFATAQLLKGFPIEFLPVNEELTTPTGAAILTTIAEPNNELVFDKVEKIGMAAGFKQIPEYPNLLRLFLGTVRETIIDECLVIETNIDDMNPQDYELLFEHLYQAGALEVCLIPVIMKHSRPGIILKVLCAGHNREIFDILLKETTTIGVRWTYSKRIKLARHSIKVQTPYGGLRVKIAQFDKKPRFSLEYRDLKRFARDQNRSIIDLRDELTRFVISKIPNIKG